MRRERLLQALGQILAIIAPHHLVADAVGELADPRFQRRAPLRRGVRAALDLARPDHVGKPARGRDHFLDRAAAAGAREIVGVLAFRQQREAKAFSRLEMRQREVGGAPRRLLAGAVAVETQDRLVGHLPQQRELVFGQRGAERRDAAGKARRHHRDDVDIAFDHDQRPAVMRRLRAVARL